MYILINTLSWRPWNWTPVYSILWLIGGLLRMRDLCPFLRCIYLIRNLYVDFEHSWTWNNARWAFCIRHNSFLLDVWYIVKTTSQWARIQSRDIADILGQCSTMELEVQSLISLISSGAQISCLLLWCQFIPLSFLPLVPAHVVYLCQNIGNHSSDVDSDELWVSTAVQWLIITAVDIRGCNPRKLDGHIVERRTNASSSHSITEAWAPANMCCMRVGPAQ